MEKIVIPPILARCIEFLPFLSSNSYEIHNNIVDHLHVEAKRQQERLKELLQLQRVNKNWRQVFQQYKSCWNNCAYIFSNTSLTPEEFGKRYPYLLQNINLFSMRTNIGSAIQYLTTLDLGFQNNVKMLSKLRVEARNLKRLHIIIEKRQQLDAVLRFVDLEFLSLGLEQVDFPETDFTGLGRLPKLKHITIASESPLSADSYVPLQNLPNITSVFVDSPLDSYSELTFFDHLKHVSTLRIRAFEPIPLDTVSLPSLLHLTIESFGEELTDVSVFGDQLLSLHYILEEEYSEDDFNSASLAEKHKPIYAQITEILENCHKIEKFSFIVIYDIYTGNGYQGTRYILEMIPPIQELFKQCMYADQYFKPNGRLQLIDGLRSFCNFE